MESQSESNREKRIPVAVGRRQLVQNLSDAPASGTSPHRGGCYTSAGKRDMWTLGNVFNILRFYV